MQIIPVQTGCKSLTWFKHFAIIDNFWNGDRQSDYIIQVTLKNYWNNTLDTFIAYISPSPKQRTTMFCPAKQLPVPSHPGSTWPERETTIIKWKLHNQISNAIAWDKWRWIFSRITMSEKDSKQHSNVQSISYPQSPPYTRKWNFLTIFPLPQSSLYMCFHIRCTQCSFVYSQYQWHES